ncbi:hypothetical protein [uncultured Roseobacter sp.]|uniref:hypothetical protein n=1 Tax=uncultured Roseobacter sp. TaxID=114847 RepID=UPI00261C4FFE|nr:hypothetical protein [uncultured Roseobacter sp.]
MGTPALTRICTRSMTLLVLLTTPFAVIAETGAPALRNGITMNQSALHQNGVVGHLSADSFFDTQELRVVEINVDSLVRLIAEHHALVPQISDRVRGSVNNIRLQGDLKAMMTTLARHSDIDWFVYDGILSVTNLDETATRFIPLDGLTLEGAVQLLTEADLNPEQFHLRQIANGTAIRVSGPPRAVEVVEALILLSTTEDSPDQEVSHAQTANTIVIRRGTSKYVETYGQAAIAQLDYDRQSDGFDPLDPATETGQINKGNDSDPKPVAN